MKRKILRLNITIILVVVLSVFWHQTTVSAKESMKEELLEDIENVILWKKSVEGIAEDRPLLNTNFLSDAGDASGDWYPFGIGRIGYPDDYEAYLSVVKNEIEERYRKDEKLHESKATEWHRISLAILAMGGDPTKIGIDDTNSEINLIADGTYDRGKTAPLDLQGINGLTWGLITLDSLLYEVPEDAPTNRKEIIVDILQRQLADGGFALIGEKSDPDITGMVIQALAPYYNSEEIYTYKQASIKEEVQKKVRDVIDEALETLSELQLDSGGFKSLGVENTESTVQVLVALTELGIDPLEDERFIKNGNSAYDFIKNYQREDGGFIHSTVYDEENPTSLPDESNPIASEQALYGFVSLYRLYNGNRTLYDFREELDDGMKNQIDDVIELIDRLDAKNENIAHVQDVFEQYKKIPVSERRYVFNYKKLANLMEDLKIENDSEPIAEYIGETSSGNGAVTLLFTEEFHRGPLKITDEDIRQFESLPKETSTEYYIFVTKLLDSLNKAENKDDYKEYIPLLEEKKKEIEELEKEIELLNEKIVEHMYPIEQLTAKDRPIINEIIEQYEQLPAYDQQKIVNYEDVERAEAQVNSVVRSKYIFVVVTIGIFIAIVIMIRRRNKRKRKSEIVDVHHH